MENAVFATAVEEIKNLHSSILGSARTSLDSAIRIGELLTTIRGALKHGDWQDWVESNVPFTYRTAHRYISCYDRRDQIKSDNLSCLGEAYALVQSTNGTTERAPQRLHESNFYTKSIRLTQTLMGDINHELKDRPVEQWDRNNLITLAAALEPLAELYSKLKSLL